MGSEHGLGSWQRIGYILDLPVSAKWKTTLIAITVHEAMRDGVCRASISTLAKKASVSRRWLGLELEPIETAGLIAIDQRFNGKAPVIEVCWEQIKAMLKNDTCANHAQASATHGTLSEPSPAQIEQATCANHAQAPAQNEHEPVQTMRTSALVIRNSATAECGSRQALTCSSLSKKVPGSTLTQEEIEERKKLCDELRPAWAKKGGQ